MDASLIERRLAEAEADLLAAEAVRDFWKAQAATLFRPLGGGPARQMKAVYRVTEADGRYQVEPIPTSPQQGAA